MNCFLQIEYQLKLASLDLEDESKCDCCALKFIRLKRTAEETVPATFKMAGSTCVFLLWFHWQFWPWDLFPTSLSYRNSMANNILKISKEISLTFVLNCCT